MQFVRRLRLRQKSDKNRRNFTWRPTCIYMTDLYHADKLCSLWRANCDWRQSVSEENPVKHDRLYTCFKGMEKSHSANMPKCDNPGAYFLICFLKIIINIKVYPTTHCSQTNVGLTLAHNPQRVSAEAFGKKSIRAAIFHNWPIKHEIH